MSFWNVSVISKNPFGPPPPKKNIFLRPCVTFYRHGADTPLYCRLMRSAKQEAMTTHLNDKGSIQLISHPQGHLNLKQNALNVCFRGNTGIKQSLNPSAPFQKDSYDKSQSNLLSLYSELRQRFVVRFFSKRAHDPVRCKSNKKPSRLGRFLNMLHRTVFITTLVVFLDQNIRKLYLNKSETVANGSIFLVARR